MIKDVLCLYLDINMSISDIKSIIQKVLPVCEAKKQGCCLSINGYDDDERELWEIEEVVDFLKKLQDNGFFALLEVSTSCPELIRNYPGLDKLPGFGALETWMITTGRMATGKNSLNKETMQLFIEDLEVASEKAKKILLEPSYKGNIKVQMTNSKIKKDPEKDVPYKPWKFN